MAHLGLIGWKRVKRQIGTEEGDEAGRELCDDVTVRDRRRLSDTQLTPNHSSFNAFVSMLSDLLYR